VYKGRQESLGRDVAIKVLLQELVEDESLVQRFHLEARAASRLSHPNTITIYDFGQHEDMLYIAMEYLHGQPLNTVLKQGPMPAARVVHIMMQALRSLSEAHKKGIVHRDIKPDNIYLTELGGVQDFVKVLDFGVAKLKSSGEKTLTKAGMIFGPPKYMSPEQARSQDLDARSDVYALGVMMYQMLMGRVPFDADDHVSILLKHVTEPPPPFDKIRPELHVSKEFQDFVFRAMEKDVKNRYQSADEMLMALESLAMQLQIPVDKAGHRQPVVSQPPGTKSPPAMDRPSGPASPRSSPPSNAGGGARVPEFVGVSASGQDAEPLPVSGSSAPEPDAVPASRRPLVRSVDEEDPASSPVPPRSPRIRTVEESALAPSPQRGSGARPPRLQETGLVVGGIEKSPRRGSLGCFWGVLGIMGLFVVGVVVVGVVGKWWLADRSGSAGGDLEEDAAGRETPDDAVVVRDKDADTGVKRRRSRRASVSREVMVQVPAGKFRRGSTEDSDEVPVGEVYVSEFWLDRTEVTVDAYAACVSAGTCSVPGTGGRCNWGVSSRGSHPVNCVTWSQSDVYCRCAGKRLPTEGEWEKATRGTDGRTYPWGEASPTCTYAVMNEGGLGCGKNGTWPVGSKPAGASPYGALDMSGNVWEWVSDWYSSNAYADAASMRDPRGPVPGPYRVGRGGGFYNVAGKLRAAVRGDFDPANAYAGVGFRCAR